MDIPEVQGVQLGAWKTYQDPTLLDSTPLHIAAELDRHDLMPMLVAIRGIPRAHMQWHYIGFETELCVLRKIRGELYKMKGGGHNAFFQDREVSKWVWRSA